MTTTYSQPLLFAVWCALAYACGDGDRSGAPRAAELDPNVPPVIDGAWYHPAVTATWQWQLDGTVNPAYDVAIYDVDLFDSPGALITTLHGDGRAILCYFSAGSAESWRDDFGDFIAGALGDPLDGWAGERWVDIRSQNVVDITRARLTLAKKRGCDGVEADNVDGYTHPTGFDLTARDQLAFNRWLANEAHTLGLAIALKNDGGQAKDLVAYFDLELNEECHTFSECGELAPFTAAGKPILNAEYPDSLAAAQNLAVTLCPLAQSENIRTLLLPLALDDSFRVTCD